MKKRPPFHAGYLLVEVVIAAGFVVMISAIFVSIAIGSFDVERRAREKTIATHIAQEGLEATRSIADRDFDSLSLGSYGLDATSGIYVFAGTSNTYGDYTRTITVAGVQRNGSGNIVQSGGTDDPHTRLVTSIVTWNPPQGGTGTVTLPTYFMNWKPQEWTSDVLNIFQNYYRNSTQVTSADDGGVELLVATSIETLSPFLTRNLPGNSIVNEVVVDRIRDRLYIALQNNAGGNPELLSYDISNISKGAMTQSGAIELGEGSRGIAIGKDYAYVLTDDPGTEILVVRLRDFTIVTTWDLPGDANTDPLDILLDETTQRLVVGRGTGGDDMEFFVLSTANPVGPLTIVTSTTIGADINGIAIRGDFAYLVTNRIDGELSIVQMNTASIVKCDLPGTTQDAVEIHIDGDRLFIGRKGGSEHEFAEYAINPNTPGTCDVILNLVGSTDFSTDDIFSMSVLAHEEYALFAMNDDNKEVRLVNLSTFLEVGDQNLSGDKCDAITFFGAYIFAGCRDNSSSLQVLEGTSVRAVEGTITSTPFDSGIDSTSWGGILWTTSGPSWIYVRIRTADSLQNLKQAEWVGSDGTTGTVHEESNGSPIIPSPFATGTRYIQWQATLGGLSGITPVLENISLTYK